VELSRGSSAKSRDALLREQKDLIAIQVMARCRSMRIRVLAGGGSVLTAQRLISPTVSNTLSLVVDPASSHHLLRSLREDGWHDAPHALSYRILPTMERLLRHHDWIAQINLFSVIPGFFADPEETFDLLWERRRQVPVRGESIAGLDRLASAVLASHNNLNRRGSHATSHSAFFAEQFRNVLDQDERAELGLLVKQVGGGGEMSAFLESLGIPPVPFALPSREYVRWRLQVEEPSDQLKRAVALLELPARGRSQLYESKSGRPKSFRDVVRMFVSLPSTFRAVFGAKRRWAAIDDAP
jgi:hypothetical protein